MNERYMCIYCGSRIDAEDMRCTYCGTRYERETGAAVAIAIDPTPVQTVNGIYSISKELVERIGTKEATDLALKGIARDLSLQAESMMKTQIKKIDGEETFAISARLKIIPFTEKENENESCKK